MKKRFIKNLPLLLMILPAAIYFFIFCYIPMGGVILAFERYNYADGVLSPFVGLENFKFLFLSGDAFRITRNTILYNFAFIVINLVLQIFCAVLLSEITSKYFKKITQSLMFFPYFLSWVVVGAFVYNLFNYEYGFVNGLLRSLGMNPINIYMETSYFPFIIILFQAWKSLGYGTVIYLAAIGGIDQEMYEAADLDGANIIQKIFNITIPMLKPTIFTLLLLNLSHVVKGDFNMFFNLTGNNPMLYSNTDIIETYVYRALTSTGDVGMGAAAGLYQAVFGFIIIMTVNTVIRRKKPEYALF